MLQNIGPRYISKGIRVGVAAPWISHLLFADDYMIFTQASKKCADRIAAILEDYNRAQGSLLIRISQPSSLAPTAIRNADRKY